MEYYKESGFKIEYDEEERSAFIEVDDRFNPTLEGIKIFEISLSEILQWFQTRDQKIYQDDSGITSLEVGVSIHAPTSEGEKGSQQKPQLVSIFCQGYYDELIEQGIM